VVVQVVEIDETAVQLTKALNGARDRGVAVAVGPLTRTLASAVGDGRVPAPLPLITLTLPDNDVALAPASLAFGLSAEVEARQIVRAALRELPTRATVVPLAGPRFVVLAGSSPLARRVATAFRSELRDAGEAVSSIDARVTYDALQTLTEQMAARKPDAAFFALEAREAAAIRPRLSRALPIYATSQINLGGAEATLLAPELEGVRFVDAPWLLEPDHPAVMVHSRPDQALSGELQRLYALGIDAYRLALEWAQGKRAFQIDGVTGALRVDREHATRVERLPTLAVFRNGVIERTGLGQ